MKPSIPGISRRHYGRGYVYYYSNGNKVIKKEELTRIKKLAIPPAYHHVWICPWANGHIQAMGQDDKNRKQYIYHSLWNEVRQQQKFNAMIKFGDSLRTIRNHINKVLENELSLEKEQMICAALYLIDTSCIRIGNPIYAKTNKTYGVTTLRKKHLSILRNEAILDFEGKNSQKWHIEINNKKIVNLLKKCEEIPGYELFKYYNKNNKKSTITSQDINNYLFYLTHHFFTAKDFRTWIASRETFLKLMNFSDEKNNKGYKKIIKEVATLLGHTPLVCQKSYIYPEIISWWKKGKLNQWKNEYNKENHFNKDELFLMWLKTIKKI